MLRDREEPVVDDVDPEGGDPESHKPVPEESRGEDNHNLADAKTLREMQKRLETAERRNTELAESERYWEQRARGTQQPAPEAEDEPGPEEDEPEITDKNPETLVDDITERGIDALVKRGVLTKKAARELVQEVVEKEARKIAREEIGVATNALTVDARLASDFPELKDPKSQLFLKTRELYREKIQRNPARAKDPEILLDCAEIVKARLDAETARRGRGRDEEEEEENRESRRQDRIRAQSGGGNRRRSEIEDEEQLFIGDEARKLMRAFGLTEDEFLAEKRRDSGMRRER